MSTDAFRRLRRTDPAAAMPTDDEHDRERLRRAIVATPLDPKMATRRRRFLRRPAALIFVGAAVLLLGAGAVYAKTVLLQPIAKQPEPSVSAAQSRREYLKWTRQIALPQGAHWRAYRAAVYAGGTVDSIHFEVVSEAIGQWTMEWLTAAAEGDAARVATARDWVSRLRATIPTITNEDTAQAFHSKYGTESMSGFDEDAARFTDDMIAAARNGQFARLVSSYCFYTKWPGKTTPSPRDPGQVHEVAWRVTLDGKAPGEATVLPAVTAAQARAEGQALLRAVGAPAGSGLARRLLDGAGGGVDPRMFPPGALTFDDQYRLGDGFQEAFEKLWVAWWHEWVAAAKAGDRTRIAAAVAATDRLEHLLPAKLSAKGHVMTLALEPKPAHHDLVDLADRARAGDLSGVASWLDFQRRYWEVRLDWAGDFGPLNVCGDTLYPVRWIVSAGVPAQTPAVLVFERGAERAWLACWREWVAAAAAGDQQKVTGAERASERLREQMVHGESGRVVLCKATLRQFDRLSAQARRGDLQGVTHWLIYQVMYRTQIGKMALTGMTG